MPQLDVSFMTTDPMLADTFAVRRKLNVVGTDGRAKQVPDTLFPKVRGVVTQQDASILLQAEDGQSFPKRIFIASRFQFIAAATDYTGDEVTWNGIVYICSSSLPYSRFGAGTYEAICDFRGNIPPAQ